MRVVLLALALCAGSTPQVAAETRRAVLLLFPERLSLPGLSRMDASLTRTLETWREPVEIYRETLDESRFTSPDHLPRLREYLRTKYAGVSLDAIVTVIGPALRFVLDGSREPLFPGVPIVFCGIDRRELDTHSLPPNVTGVFMKREFAPTLDIALKLHPGTRHVVYVAGTSDFDRKLTGQAQEELRSYAGRLEITYLTELPMAALLDRLSHLEPHTIVLYSTLFRDGAGVAYVTHEVADRLAAIANAPVYVFLDQYMGRGVVGGHLYSVEAHGEQAGRMALRILSGTPPSALTPVEAATNVDQFDWRQLRRWSIDEGQLPEGSVVLFREKTIWSEHRGKVLGGLCLFLIQAALIVALLVARRNRIRAERRVHDSERRYRTLADYTHDWEYWRRVDGSFEYVTPSCMRITGYEAAAFYENPSLLDDIVLEEERARWQAHDVQAHAGAGQLRLELRIRTADGRVLWIDHVCAPVKGEDGTILGVRGTNRDITDKKHGETELRRAVAEIERLRERLEADNTYLREQVEPPAGLSGLIGRSLLLQEVVGQVRQVAPTSTTVLLQGETGVGKELVAHALHGLSPRAARPLIKLNCAALPPALIESELFGHEKGAFTGALGLRKGRFEIADGSTLLLDEIGELPMELQAKLLRVIQDGQFERVGATVTLQTDVRLIAATNRRLKQEVAAGRFRADLWYRLNVFPITVPPLRERPDDVPMLALHFVETHCRKLGRPPLQVSEGIMRDLQSHDWPGNVRELQSVIERAVISSTGPTLRLADRPGRWSSRAETGVPTPELIPASITGPAGQTLTAMERDHIVATLEQTYWRLEGPHGAAALLGMNASTLRSRMRKLGIQRPSLRPPS